MRNPFLENIEEALNSEGKSLSQEHLELLLRQSESITALRDNEKKVLSFINDLLFRNFFNNIKTGHYYCDPSKIKEYYHINPEDRLLGGINEGMFYRLFVAYFTLKIKILEWGKLVGDDIVKLVLLDEIVRGIETELAAAFFPTPGPAVHSPLMRLVSIKVKLEKYAPNITFDEIFEIIIPCSRCKTKIKLYSHKGSIKISCPGCKIDLIFNPDVLQSKVVTDMCEIWKNRKDLFDKNAGIIWDEEKTDLEREMRKYPF